MKRWDAILVFAYVLITIAVTMAAFTVKDVHKDYDSKMLRIQVDGETVKEMMIPVSETQEFSIPTQDGYNIVRVEGEKVRIIEADCRDGICARATPISEPGEIIVCLPHKLVVEIIGSKSNTVDTTAY